ncbi:unnamed protein product [Camellia sinensis]
MLVFMMLSCCSVNAVAAACWVNAQLHGVIWSLAAGAIIVVFWFFFFFLALLVGCSPTWSLDVC